MNSQSHFGRRVSAKLDPDSTHYESILDMYGQIVAATDEKSHKENVLDGKCDVCGASPVKKYIRRKWIFERQTFAPPNGIFRQRHIYHAPSIGLCQTCVEKVARLEFRALLAFIICLLIAFISGALAYNTPQTCPLIKFFLIVLSFVSSVAMLFFSVSGGSSVYRKCEWQPKWQDKLKAIEKQEWRKGYF